jgi:hypothetical protein
MSLKPLLAGLALTFTSFAITRQPDQKISLFAHDRKHVEQVNEKLSSMYEQNKDLATPEKASHTLCATTNFQGENREICQILTRMYHAEYTKYAADKKATFKIDTDEVAAQLSKYA